MTGYSAAGAAAVLQGHADRAEAAERLRADSWDALFRGCVFMTTALTDIRDNSTDPQSQAVARAALARLGRP